MDHKQGAIVGRAYYVGLVTVNLEEVEALWLKDFFISVVDETFVRRDCSIACVTV